MSTFTKCYWACWAILAIITLGMFVAGSITWLSISVIGFVACTLVFLGMMCVTISIVSTVGPHANEFQHPDAEPLPEKKSRVAVAPSRIAAPAMAVHGRHAH